MKRLFVTALLIALMMIVSSAYVIFSAWFWNKAQNEDIVLRTTQQPLPEKCSPYYGDGSGRWPECMGVGYK